MAFSLLIALALTLLTGQQADADGFSPLFNGRDLAGWVKEGPAGFRVKGGELICDGSGNYPTWLRTEETFENFILRLEFRHGLYGDSGVFLQAPKHGRNSNVGFEVQISDDTRDPGLVAHSCGAIFAAVPPLVRAAKPLEEWNQLEIEFDWPKLRVTLNGKVVQDLDIDRHPELRERLRSGYLGLQDRGAVVHFRNIRVKRLPAKEVWKTLFNGKDFTGWKFHDEGAKWSIEEGAIVGRNGNGYCMTQQEFTNFDLRLYVQSSHLSNGGVFIRWKSRADRGAEIQIEDIPDSNNPTGSVYDRARATHLPLTPGEWALMQIRAEGSVVAVRVNGELVARAVNVSARPGTISLQMHKRGGVVRFKDIQIKPIGSSRAAPETGNN